MFRRSSFLKPFAAQGPLRQTAGTLALAMAALFRRLTGEPRTGYFRISRPGTARLLTLIAQGEMRPADAVIVLALGQAASLNYGTAAASIRRLAEATGLSSATVQESLRRLERERLVLRPGKRRGWRAGSKIVNPELICSGHPDRIRSHWAYWAAVESEAGPCPPPPPSAIKARLAKPLAA